MDILVSIGLVQLMAVISPGPSFLITAQTAVAGSRFDGVKVALGLSAGAMTWAGATVLGLHIVFQQLPWLYLGMKIGGALFLVWVAVQIIRHAAEPVDLEAVSDADRQKPFLRGFLTQISNPKVVVFFGSIFIAMLPSDVPVWMSVALVLIIGVNDLTWYTVVALFFGAPPVRKFYLDAKVWIDWSVGLFLVAVGLRLIWAALDT